MFFMYYMKINQVWKTDRSGTEVEGKSFYGAVYSILTLVLSMLRR